jgi:hypothetical protein
MHTRFVRRGVALAIMAAAPALAGAQQATATVVTPAFDFSGVLFGSYQWRLDSLGQAQTGGSHPNQFTLDRAYLTFRMPAGDNGQIRVTTDVFQNTNNATNSFYQGWLIRIKYGYLQYTGLRNSFGDGSSLVGRIGILHTVVIDYEEQFWPRYLQQTAVERNGFFSSADGGIAALATLGNHLGEVYATVTNGPGYTSFEKDRFKDPAARVSFTPFGNSKTLSPIVKSWSITPWFYKGWVASTFAAGGPNEVGPGDNGAITEGLTRDRFGIFTGVRERRINAGLEYAQRQDESDRGGNTLASPRLVTDSTGRLFDGFIVGRPVEWFKPQAKSGLQVIGRFDHFTPNTDPTEVNGSTNTASYAGTTPSYNFWILGVSYDVNQRMTFALDWQKQQGTGFPPPAGTNIRAIPVSSSLFMQWQATF